MKTFLSAGACALALWLSVVIGASAQAAPPSDYLVLHPNMVKTGKHGRRIYHPGNEVPAVAQGYAYGWFGAAPRGHWSRHTGYYNQYIRWSYK